MLQYTKVRLGLTCADVWICWVEAAERRDTIMWATGRLREKDETERER